MIDLTRAAAHYQRALNDLEEATILLREERIAGTCNRAYYALFDGILTVLYTTDGPVPKTHTGAHTEFRKQFIRSGIFAGNCSNTITALFNLRQGGDYDIDFDISLDDVQDADEQATQFLESVRVYRRQQGLY
ncbi:HEPN domain-containing protein [uncultured Fibrella sp.]|uniref:HEPN domain-containing protein n=1 Tax=uncultured Fibrella sp. TaxID=1284596 RepID=UPI0035CC41F7